MSNSYIKQSRKPSQREIFLRRMMASEILSTLSENNFKRCERLETKFGEYSEIVYAKPLESNNRYIVAVYTSCDHTNGAYSVKKKGADAIRIAGLYIDNNGKEKGVIKNTRVNRVGPNHEISKRMMERVVKTFRELSENNMEFCKDCGAPKFTSKKGNLVCSEICWSKK